MAQQDTQSNQIRVTLPTRWVDDASPVVFVNQFILQQVGHQVQLVVGHAPFPLVLGTAEEQREEVEKRGFIPVHVRGRFVLDEHGLRSLHAILASHVPEEENQVPKEGA